MRHTRRIALTITLMLAGATLGAGIPVAPAFADQHGLPPITINPGGGQLADGSDGLRFAVNSDADWFSGHDAIHYRGKAQYCCSAAAPMLNVGGMLFGQSGPASFGHSWSSLEVLGTTGSAVLGSTPAAVTGDGSITLRYTAQKNGLDYVMDRTVSYLFPNHTVIDRYSVIIPPGNTETVKFFQGGDTAPGGSDTGPGSRGMMLTEPVRSAISLNPDTQVLVGYREAPDSNPFDGAVSGHFLTPYDLVKDGGDIGFGADADLHDAGLMMQWTLGSTPGAYTPTMETLVSVQGVTLSASVPLNGTFVGTPFTLDLTILNTSASSATGLGYRFTIPAGMALAGVPTNGCGGTFAHSADAVTLATSTVGSMDSCVVSIPVVSALPGDFILSGSAVTNIAGLLNVVDKYLISVLQPPTRPTTGLGQVVVGTAVLQQLGGTVPMTYSMVTGSLPSGLVLSATGELSGTPRQAGLYSFTVRANSSTAAFDQPYAGTVDKGATAVTGTLSDDRIRFGEQVTLQPRGIPAAASGTVTFVSGARELCRVGAASGASCSTSPTLPAGSYADVQVQYSGDANWLASSQRIGALVVMAATSPVAPAQPSAPASPVEPAALPTTGASIDGVAQLGALLGGLGLLLIWARFTAGRRTRG